MAAINNIATNTPFASYNNASGTVYAQADKQRNKQPSAYSWNTTATVRYYAPSFEREISNEKTTDYTYIESPNGLVAAIKTAGSQHDVMLLATDHLGSIIGVWNASGTLLEEHRYSAWGLRTSSTANPRLQRGFTGHEHLQQFGLIDMQARLYDPHLGRFLAPDPYVQAPENHLSLNRYAYCMNNPLKYVDPTGEKWWHWALGDILSGGLLSTTALLTAEVATTTLITTGLTSYMTMFPNTTAGYEIQKLTSPIALKFNFGFGSQSHFGIDASFGLPNYRWHCGATHFSNNVYGNKSGWETRTGAEFKIAPFITISGTKYKGDNFEQTTNRITLGGPFTNVSYENDYLFGLGKVLGRYNADEGDRWRTAAVQMNFGPLSIGLNMFTGDPGLNDRMSNVATIDGHETYMGGTANDPNLRAGVLYIGVGSIKIGRNSEQIRKVFQNQFAHDFLMGGKAKWFQVLPIPPTWFFYFGTGGSSLW